MTTTTTPSMWAQITADTLDERACRQITRFLRNSAAHDAGAADEKAVMLKAAVALDEVLSWQTPKEAAGS